MDAWPEMPPAGSYTLLAVSATILMAGTPILAKRASEARLSYTQKVMGLVLLSFPFVGTWHHLVLALAIALLSGDGEPSLHGVIRFLLLAGIGPAMLMLVLLKVEREFKDANRI